MAIIAASGCGAPFAGACGASFAGRHPKVAWSTIRPAFFRFLSAERIAFFFPLTLWIPGLVIAFAVSFCAH